MSDLDNNSEIVKNDKPLHNNTDMIYDYTLYRLKLTNHSIDQLNSKLASIVAFSGLVIFFLINLPDSSPSSVDVAYLCYSCFLIKMLISILLIAMIWVCIFGFFPKSGGRMPSVKYLLEEHRRTTNEYLKLELVATWVESLKELDLIRDERTKAFKRAIIFLGACISLAAIDIFLVYGLAMLPK
ncbi:MAG: hypothetical protein F6K35_50840 [Okeania sp. SIO2H7]|nr:hypothetical protein [Okeania sp. SIO2H7]